MPGHAGEWSQAVPLCSMDGYVTMGSVDVRLRGSTGRELAGYPHMKVRESRSPALPLIPGMSYAVGVFHHLRRPKPLI